MRLSHGENRGSSPLGSANNINKLDLEELFVSNICPTNIRGHAKTYASKRAVLW